MANVQNVPDYLKRKAEQPQKFSGGTTIYTNWKYDDDIGRKEIYRMLEAPIPVYRFAYPSMVEEDEGWTQRHATFNMAGKFYHDWNDTELATDNVEGRSATEKNMLLLFLKTHSDKLQTFRNKIRNYSQEEQEEKIKSWRFMRNVRLNWGKGENRYCVQVLTENKTIQTLELKSTTWSPWNRYQGKFVNNASFSEGINQILTGYKHTDAQGFFEFTPFLGRLALTGQQSSRKAFGSYYVDIAPSYLQDRDDFKYKLPSTFAACIWVHPGDAQKVVEYYQKPVDQRGDGFDYRAYPSDDGQLVFVSLHNGDAISFSSVFSEHFTEQDLEIIKAHDVVSYNAVPSTDHSLLGGLYYNKGTDRIPVDIQFVKNNQTGEFDEDGNPEITVGQDKKFVYFHEGLLWRKPLCVHLRDSDENPVFENEDTIAQWAVGMGIPVIVPKGAGQFELATPAPTKPNFKVNQSSQVKTESNHQNKQEAKNNNQQATAEETPANDIQDVSQSANTSVSTVQPWQPGKVTAADI